MPTLHSTILLLLGLWTLTTTAQFGFFDQMFGNSGGQQQQQQANVRSDSSWYQAQYENGKLLFTQHLRNPLPPSHHCAYALLDGH